MPVWLRAVLCYQAAAPRKNFLNPCAGYAQEFLPQICFPSIMSRGAVGLLPSPYETIVVGYGWMELASGHHVGMA